MQIVCVNLIEIIIQVGSLTYCSDGTYKPITIVEEDISVDITSFGASPKAPSFENCSSLLQKETTLLAYTIISNDKSILCENGVVIWMPESSKALIKFAVFTYRTISKSFPVTCKGEISLTKILFSFFSLLLPIYEKRYATSKRRTHWSTPVFFGNLPSTKFVSDTCLCVFLLQAKLETGLRN